MDLFHHLQRQAAFSRATFGPAVRTLGITEHIKSELTEIKDAPSSGGRSKEWVDVALLAFDGLLRSCREELSTPKTGTANNAMIAERACRLFQDKQCENEMRIWPDYRTISEDAAINHQTDLPRKFTGPVSGQVKAGGETPVWGDINETLMARAGRKTESEGLPANELIHALEVLTEMHGNLPVRVGKSTRKGGPVAHVTAVDARGDRVITPGPNYRGIPAPAVSYILT